MTKELKYRKDEKLYVVVCKFRNKEWGVAYFWNGLPYTSKHRRDITRMRDNIVEYAKNSRFSMWHKKDFKVVKINLSELFNQNYG